jgi:hypothetical protein
LVDAWHQHASVRPAAAPISTRPRNQGWRANAASRSRIVAIRKVVPRRANRAQKVQRHGIGVAIIVSEGRALVADGDFTGLIVCVDVKAWNVIMGSDAKSG